MPSVGVFMSHARAGGTFASVGSSPSGPASKGKSNKNVVLVEVGGVPVKSLDDFTKVVSQLPNGANLFVTAVDCLSSVDPIAIPITIRYEAGVHFQYAHFDGKTRKWVDNKVSVKGVVSNDGDGGILTVGQNKKNKKNKGVQQGVQQGVQLVQGQSLATDAPPAGHSAKISKLLRGTRVGMEGEHPNTSPVLIMKHPQSTAVVTGQQPATAAGNAQAQAAAVALAKAAAGGMPGQAGQAAGVQMANVNPSAVQAAGQMGVPTATPSTAGEMPGMPG